LNLFPLRYFAVLDDLRVRFAWSIECSTSIQRPSNYRHFVVGPSLFPNLWERDLDFKTAQPSTGKRLAFFIAPSSHPLPLGRPSSPTLLCQSRPQCRRADRLRRRQGPRNILERQPPIPCSFRAIPRHSRLRFSALLLGSSRLSRTNRVLSCSARTSCRSHLSPLRISLPPCALFALSPDFARQTPATAADSPAHSRSCRRFQCS